MDEVRRNGSNKINLKEFRERMIKNGFNRPKFFQRVDERSPKPVSKIHEKLYKEQSKNKKVLQEKKDLMESEEMKECTFAPKVNKNSKFNKRYARSPRPQENTPLIPEETSTMITNESSPYKAR
jgi:hypothetical protein